MARQSIFDMKVSRVYPLLLQKVERKGRTKAELDEVIAWLTGYDMNSVDQDMTYGTFFERAPAMNPRAALIHDRIETAVHFHLSDSRAKSIEQTALHSFREELHW